MPEPWRRDPYRLGMVVKPFWYPQSALLLPDPPSLASTGILRMLLARGRSLELLYAGDRMWPTIRHGQSVRVDAVSTADLAPGAIVLCAISGVPDVLRVLRIEQATVRLQGDADPHETFTTDSAGLLGRLRLTAAPSPQAARVLRRWWLDLQEAARGRPDASVDLASTVREKYEAQAPFYAQAPLASDARSIPAALMTLLRERVRPEGCVLVAGSGTGRECLALAALGWTVRGVDFSPAMIDLAGRRSHEAGVASSALTFVLGDLTMHEEVKGSLAAIYFTYDVHSFLPDAAVRAALLRRMFDWLEPGGILLLSARRTGRIYDAAILSLERAARGFAPDARWGHSHTRWLAADGSMHRSFVHVFTRRSIERETAQAGFRTERWLGNHCVLARIDRPSPTSGSALA